MGFSLTRLTYFGIISSIDEDLREIVRLLIPNERPASDFFGPALFAKLNERLNRSSDDFNASMIDFLDMGDSLSLIQKYKSSLTAPESNFFERTHFSFEQIIGVRNRVMHARPLEFSDGVKVEKLTNDLKNAPQSLFRRTVEFLQRLATDPYLPFSLDVSAIEAQHGEPNHNLPIPDFDETGFLGRQREAEDLITACKGPWPIITVVGEGGYGKTALALQVAYKLLDDTDNPFEYIVWTTSKTTRLSLSDIERIENSITSSIGMFQDVSRTLTGKSLNEEQSTEEVLNYLNEFRILLILDNLETIMDKRIIDLFSRLNGRSKILVTSRLGTGEMNYRFPLGPLSEDDGVRLLRSTAKVRNVKNILQLDKAVLASYCRRMKGNPGFIKWFVSSVQCGKRPENVLVEPKVFLDFCLSNVYDYISEDARNLVNVMISIPGPHTQSVLSYISGLNGDRFQSALQSLWSANLVQMSSVSTSVGQQTVYEPGELPRLFLIKNHPPSQIEIRSHQSKKRSLDNIYRNYFSDSRQDRYSFNNITLRSKDDTALAHYLRIAIQETKNYSTALEHIEEAKALDPSYYEVHRVEAVIHRNFGNFTAAREAYEVALDCERNSAPLHFWYAGFLMRDADDSETAARHFGHARTLDPSSPRVILESARCMMFDRKYDEADQMLCTLFDWLELSPELKRKLYHLALQISLRRTESKVDAASRVLELIDFVSRYKQIPKSLLDSKINETLLKARTIAKGSLAAAGTNVDGDAFELCSQFFETIVSATQSPEWEASPLSSASPRDSDVGMVFSGAIHNYNFEKKYGFLEYGDSVRVFFHHSDIDSYNDEIVAGASAHFSIVKDALGRFRASGIHIFSGIDAIRDAERPLDGHELTPDERRTGIIKSVLPEKGFGFLYSNDSTEIFFHKSGLTKGLIISSIAVGDHVTYVEAQNSRGTCAEKISLLE
ncbi:cold shock domain-containing protein [Georhizobium sp. MAB10]|uniref:cold shock domain-containing protein n=1 Tax=Georhizobium sp. MAB10 TaxID=3028319 RepID=UPI003855DA56